MASEPSDPRGPVDRDQSGRAREPKRAESPLAWVGAGFELAGAVGLLALLGYVVDSWLGSGPWGLVVGAMIGIIGGLYNLIKKAMRDNR